MIVYEIGRGLIYAGNTELSSSLVVSETGPLELTISSGSYTSTGNKDKGIPPRVYNLTANAVCPIFNTADSKKYYQAQLVASQWEVEILWKSNFELQPEPPLPDGFELIQYIVFAFEVPPHVQSIADIKINVFKVLPGFPPGSNADDWGNIHLY